MQPTHSQTEVPPYQMEDAVEIHNYKESDPPPSYNEIHLPPYAQSQSASFQNTTNYGACPTVPPPPYTPSPTHLPSSSHRSPKNDSIPESDTMIPLNGSSSTFQTEEPSCRKKYAAYTCCALFLILVMFAAYLGRSTRKHHSHYRYNYDWNY